MNTITKKDLVDVFRPLVSCFLGKMTPESLDHLTEGSPDLATVKLLAELMLELVAHCAQAMVTVLKDSHSEVSTDIVKSTLGGTVEQVFAQELKVKSHEDSESSADLTELIAEEVAAQVNSELGSAKKRKCLHLTPPTCLSRMTECASNMIRGFILKLKEGYSSCKRASITNTPSVKFFGSDASQIESLTDDDIVSASPQTVHDLMDSGIKEMVRVLEDDLTEAEYEHVMSHIEQETVAVEKVIVDKIKKQKSVLSCAKNLKDKGLLCIQQIGSIIRDFFAKVYMKVAVISACAQLRKKFRKSSEDVSAGEMNSLISRVDSLFEATDENGRPIGDFETLEAVSKGENEAFLAQLQVVMVTAVAETRDDQLFRQSPKKRAMLTIRAIREEVDKKIRTLIGLLKFWIQIHANKHRDKFVVVLAGDYRQCVECTAPCYDLQREEVEKANMSATIISLVSLLMKKSSCSKQGNDFVLGTHVSWLVEEMWAQLQGSDFNIPAYAMKPLPKMMYRALCTKWGSADDVLSALIMHDLELIWYLEKCFTVLPKVFKKPGAVRRFCSFVARIFSRGHRSQC